MPGHPAPGKLESAALERGLQRLHAYIRKQGLKASNVRDAVARAALSIEGHFDVDSVRRVVPQHDRATIYRVLPVLIDAGLLQFVSTPGSKQIFERAFERQHHDHLECTECKRIVEFHSKTIVQLQHDVAKRFGFSLTRPVHKLYGLCSKCRRTSKRRSSE